MVINAAGVWAGELTPGLTLRPSRGSHLVFRQESFGGLTAALTVPVPGTMNRFCFALPAPDRRVYLGITDVDAPGSVPDVPVPSDAEIDFLLTTVNASLGTALTPADVIGSYAGLRPLLDTGTGSGDSTADISRKHAVITSDDGMVTIVGGKLTTYRRMAEDALDAALRHSGVHARPCTTASLPLLGAASRTELSAVSAPPHLVRRYGTLASEVAAAGPLTPVADGLDTTEAELRYAVTHELALEVEDLLARRTRVAMAPADAAAARPVAEAALAGSH
jgi:glycerol-3-phosphate dehydrogenase